MKMSTLSSLFVLLSVVSMIAIAPSAFADHHAATVTNSPGSQNNDSPCQDDNTCFAPNPVTISIGGTVTWDNSDGAAGHTASYGANLSDPEWGSVWDSGLIMPGQSYTTPAGTFDVAGSYNYFCMVHPWMQGTVIVEDTAAEAAVAEAAVAAAAAEMAEAAAAEATAAEAAAADAAAADAAAAEAAAADAAAAAEAAAAAIAALEAEQAADAAAAAAADAAAEIGRAHV